MLKATTIMALVMCAITSISSFANSGKAIVSHFYSDTYAASNQTDGMLFVTNIASESVTITVTMYDDNGNVIFDTDNNPNVGIIKASNTTSYSDSSSHSAKFNLAPNSTSRVWLDAQVYPGISGYAIIKWEKAENTPTVISHALVSHALMYRVHQGHVGYYGVAVNNGNPF